ncbi:hypothetical protein ONE63_001167 [Megalurothrips usitatus]|uniref:Uncharacterized protein n=1 Tax=Megalurothrips usitatus TaxID=439358 RepID=A0AAV7XFW6_9NEOP|nr:hypothetical protein ONE63_001167 [Megalurothrips usitatus]
MLTAARLLVCLMLVVISKDSAGDLLQSIRSLPSAQEHRVTSVFGDVRILSDDPAATRSSNCSDCGPGSASCSGCKASQCPERVVTACRPRCSSIALSCVQERCGGLSMAGCAEKCIKESAVTAVACMTAERVSCGVACDVSCACPESCSSTGGAPHGAPPLLPSLAAAAAVAALSWRHLAAA